MVGNDRETTILDAEFIEGVMDIVDCENNLLKNISIIRGLRPSWSSITWGHGIHVYNSSSSFENMSIRDNNIYGGFGIGGGIYFEFSNGLGFQF